MVSRLGEDEFGPLSSFSSSQQRSCRPPLMTSSCGVRVSVRAIAGPRPVVPQRTTSLRHSHKVTRSTPISGGVGPLDL